MHLRLRTFIVTGGGSGLGEAACRYLVRAGANVVIFDRDETTGERTATLLKGAALFVQGDVTDEGAVLEAIKRARESWPKRTLAGVVNCAGIANAGRIVSSKGVPYDQEIFETIYKVNVFGTFNVSRLVAAAMLKNEPDENGERGIIINVSSISYQDGQVGQCAYASSKGAVASLTLPIARDLARHGIRCVAIAPGLFETSMSANTPPKAREAIMAMTEFPARLGLADEFGQLVPALIENTMLNGEVIRLDGAMRLGKL